jgi:hypothetical protein
MNEPTHDQQNSCPGCIDAEGAWWWVHLTAEVALDEGDEDAITSLPNVLEHWLLVRQWEVTS